MVTEVGVPKWNAAHVFEELDMNDDSSLSANEYFPAFGASLADMGKKVKEHFGQPQDAFKKADADGSGKVTLEDAMIRSSISNVCSTTFHALPRTAPMQ